MSVQCLKLSYLLDFQLIENFLNDAAMVSSSNFGYTLQRFTGHIGAA